MSQQHKIMRMVLELADCPAEAADQAQTGLRRAQQERLLPAIDRICSALGTADRVHRIARLELDLGSLPLPALEAELGERFEAAFSRQLAAALQDAPAVDADLELLRLFIASGSLPWWADPQDRGLLAASLRRLLARSPLAPWQALAAAPDAEQGRRRLVRALPDEALQAWLAPRLPAAPAANAGDGGAADWLALLATACSSLALAPRQARHHWWEALLHLADPAAAKPATPDWPVQALRQLAAALGLEWPALVLALDRAAASAPAAVRDTLRPLARQAAGAAATQAGRAAEPPAITAAARARDMLARLLAELAQPAPPGQDFWLRLTAALQALPAALGGPARAALNQACTPGPPQDIAARRALARRLRGLAALDAPPASEDQADALDSAAAGRAPAPADASQDFSQADEVYVQNAGLVILWPFLPAFLARLGLVHERRFVDAAAAHRAAGLLQVLASGEEDPHEPLLPLNKLLCGLPADAVFDFGPPLAAEEMSECQGLLAAVIQQAPILREMSIAGFRASFLLRRGQLSAQGSHWLLRVERETHDIVLERFPWGFNPVKLPWMRALLQVEW